MSDATAALVANFEGAAKRAQEAETALRKRVAEEIARLERQRAFAFRRARLVRLLATSAEGPQNHEEVAAAQRTAIAEELGWEVESASYKAILDEMKPLGLSVWRCVSNADGSTPELVEAEIEKFETWFEGKHGTSFYALFDQYVPEAPLVDF